MLNLLKFNNKLNLFTWYIFLLISLVVSKITHASPTEFSYNKPNNKFLPKHKPIPGGLAIIPLDLESINMPVVFFNNRQVLVIKYNNIACKNHETNHSDWVAIVGIPMDTKTGLHKITIYLNDEQQENKFEDYLEKSFMVSPSKYPAEKLKLQTKFVTPSYAEQIRINKEKKLIENAYNHRSRSLPNLKLKKPIIGRRSSPFGLKRILNGQYKGFHSGLDLAAPIGTKVHAAGHGKVILTGDFFYVGYAVFIDHGQGLITNYSHLNSIEVNEGDQVDPETIIGTVGTTGRSTGPHLHWSVSLNDVRVNPELFLEISE